MEVNRLLDSELSYKILIRHGSVNGTVEEKRSRLRQLLRQEREGGAVAPTSVFLNADEELDISSIKLTALEEEIESFNFENRKNELQRLYTRLLHVTLRLGRIIAQNKSHNKFRNDLLEKKVANLWRI